MCAALRCAHPNVVEVYDFGVLPGSFPFLTMELLAGADLQHRVQADWEAFYSVALQAAAGLAHIHRHGIVHLDVKPANLGLVEREDGSLGLKILDFGLAQNVRGPLDRRIRGTLAYVAPEVLLQDRYDHRADLYSLGMTLFQLATGVLPSAGNDAAAIRFHLQAEAPDPLAYRPDMPRASPILPACSTAIRRGLPIRSPAERASDVAGLRRRPGVACARRRASARFPHGRRDDMVETLRGALARAGRGEPQLWWSRAARASATSRLCASSGWWRRCRARVGIVARRHPPRAAARRARRPSPPRARARRDAAHPPAARRAPPSLRRLGDELRARHSRRALVLLLGTSNSRARDPGDARYAASEIAGARL